MIRWHLATDEQLLVIFKHEINIEKVLAVGLIEEMSRRRLLDTFIKHHINKMFGRCKRDRRYELEELMQWGYFAIAEGLECYEKGHNIKLSTFFHQIIERRMRRIIEHNSFQKRTGEVVSLNYQVGDDGKEFIDMLVERQSVEKTVINRVLFEGWFSLLEEKEKQVLQLFSEGYSLREISGKMGYKDGATMVSKLFHRAIKKINPNYEKKNLKYTGLMTFKKEKTA